MPSAYMAQTRWHAKLPMQKQAQQGRYHNSQRKRPLPVFDHPNHALSHTQVRLQAYGHTGVRILIHTRTAHTRARAHARTRTRKHAQCHMRLRTHTCAHTHTHTQIHADGHARTARKCAHASTHVHTQAPTPTHRQEAGRQ